MGRIKDSKGLYVAISILLAIIFWLYVRAENDIPMENQVRGIPIQITNEDVLESRGLMVSEIDPETINITFEGSSSVVPRLNRNNVTVSVDVSRITSEGSYDLTYTVAMPTNLNTTGGSGITRSSNVESTAYRWSSRATPMATTTTMIPLTTLPELVRRSSIISL